MGDALSAGDGQARSLCPGILDVLVDIRRGSGTFGQWEAFALNDENHHQRNAGARASRGADLAFIDSDMLRSSVVRDCVTRAERVRMPW